MIQERPDFKTLNLSDILEMLNTHEFQLSEKRDIYGPNYGRTRALKAKAISSSEEESDSSSDDPEDIGKELAMLVKKFQKFTKKKGFRKSSRSSSRNDEASAHDYKKKTCHKCKKTDHFISESRSGTMRTKRRRRARNMNLTTRRRRNTQSLLPSLPQSLHHTRRAHLARHVRLLARKWIQRRSLLLRRRRWSLRGL